MASEGKSVVIIGGGIAGLACGKKLVGTPGFNVTLLEASNRIGGRVKSTKFGEKTIELGAQWVHGEKGNVIYSMVNPLGLLEDDAMTPTFGLSAMFVTQNGEFLPEGIDVKIQKLMEKLEVSGDSAIDNEPLGQYTSRAFWKFNEENPIHESNEICVGILDWIHRMQNSIDGADSWFVTSCRGQLEYTVCAGNPTISWKPPASYATLIDIMLHQVPYRDEEKRLLHPDWIHLQKEVKSIVYSTDKEDDVTVHCEDGSTFSAQHVISTVSLGVLKERHSTLFDPPLSPERISAIDHIGFGTVDKIFLEFPSAWWPERSLGFNLVWDDCSHMNENWLPEPNFNSVLLQEHGGLPIWCRSLLGFYTLKSNPNTLFTWITGPPAHLMETLDTDLLEATLIQVLQKFVGGVFRVPDPIRMMRSKWKSNPYVRGSYSFRTVQSEEKNVSAAQLAEPIRDSSNKPVVCFAGEATHSTYYSTVHGAYETGIREAERIINHYSASATSAPSEGPREAESNESSATGGFCCSLLDLI